MNKIFIELIQVALGTREGLSRVPNEREWWWLLEEAEKQAIDGVLLCGIERLPQDQWPPLDIKLEWIGGMQFIEAQNVETTKACKRVCERFERDGFWTCVLKGQANHRYYPEEMANRRCCGDIDIWVVPREEGRCKREDVRRTLEYVEREHELTGLCWLHCNYEDESGVPVEVHFRPSFMNEPVHNRRLQRFFRNQRCHIFHKLPVEVDVVYQMNHIYRHLIDEGVGLRQVVDYYWVLKGFHRDVTENTDSSFEQKILRPDDSKRPEVGQSQIGHKFSVKKDEVMKTVEWLGMKRFAGALMYVLSKVCVMERECLLCEPNEKDGKFLLNEIMAAGNFGHSDPRMGELNTSNLLSRQVSQAWRRFRRNMRFVRSYPGEVIWEPVARMEHFAWKKMKLWKF
jgi:hypothetical protein